MADTPKAVFDGIADIGIEPERLIITHSDGDHIGGFDAIVDRYNVETWVPEQTEQDTKHSPDYQYSDGDQIGRFTAVHVPGHAPDNHALVDDGGATVVGAPVVEQVGGRVVARAIVVVGKFAVELEARVGELKTVVGRCGVEDVDGDRVRALRSASGAFLMVVPGAYVGTVWFVAIRDKVYRLQGKYFPT